MNGFFNINKPAGMTSAQVVNIVKRILGKRLKVGHMGTLDPMATGVLPIAVGRATRLFNFLLNKRKTYIATFEFGYLTDTLDKTGNVLKCGCDIPSFEKIDSSLCSFIGELEQIPPIYSAKSINGVRAYKIARSGRKVELKSSKITVYEFKILKQIDETKYQFEIECSAGTYIRSLCRDLAQNLGTCATMIDLVRTKSGNFEIQDSISPDKISERFLYSIDFVLDDLPVIEFNQAELRNLLDGKLVYLHNDDLLTSSDFTFRAVSDKKLQCLCIVDNKRVVPKVWLR